MVAVCCSHGTAQHTPGKGGRALRGRQSLKPSGSGLSKYARSALFSPYAGALKDGMHDDTSCAAEHAFRVRLSIFPMDEFREVQRKSKGVYGVYSSSLLGSVIHDRP
jgi:hypothetical protein